MNCEIVRLDSHILYFMPVDNVETLSLAFAIPVGSAHESEDQAGISHLIEHVAFKGTKNFDEFKLKYVVEVVGGTLNAFTTRDFTVYYAKVPYSSYQTAIEVLTDLVFNPLIEEKAVELEKSVVIEEIKSYNEDHISRVQDLFIETILAKPYSKPISGWEETVSRLKAQDLKKFHEEKYGNLRILAMGKVTQDVRNELLNKLRQYGKIVDEKKPRILFKKQRKVVENKNDLTQIHVVHGTPIKIGITHKQYYVYRVLETVLGSGMSSLLFKRVREDLGLVYSIDVVSSCWAKHMLFGVYACASVEKFPAYVEEMDKLRREEIDETFFEYGKKRLLGKLEMLTESVSSMFGYTLGYVLNDVAPEPIEKVIEETAKVNRKQVNDLWKEICSTDWHWAFVAPNNFKGW